MKTLTIEHLAPYIPYGLQVRHFDEDREYWSDCRIELLHIPDEATILNEDNQYDVAIGDLKPILRPLSDLTKEIEVNGDRFVPWLELRRLYGNDPVSGFDVISYNQWESLYVDFGDNCSGFSLNLMAWPLLSKLFSWHFDVFGLIPAGLAIPKEGREEI